MGPDWILCSQTARNKNVATTMQNVFSQIKCLYKIIKVNLLTSIFPFVPKVQSIQYRKKNEKKRKNVDA